MCDYLRRGGHIDDAGAAALAAAGVEGRDVLAEGLSEKRIAAWGVSDVFVSRMYDESRRLLHTMQGMLLRSRPSAFCAARFATSNPAAAPPACRYAGPGCHGRPCAVPAVFSQPHLL